MREAQLAVTPMLPAVSQVQPAADHALSRCPLLSAFDEFLTKTQVTWFTSLNPGATLLATQDLITAAEAAKAKAASDGDVIAADQAKLTADQATKATDDAVVVTENQAVHDDLAAHGPYATVSTTVPPVVTVYAAVDPGSYSATVVRTS